MVWGDLDLGEFRAGSTTTFRDFGPVFAASFGRRCMWREHSRRTDLQGLLVQAGERRNAEYLSESVGISAQGDAAFSDRGPVGRCRGHRSELQEYLATPLDGGSPPRR